MLHVYKGQKSHAVLRRKAAMTQDRFGAVHKG
jgi:hypothetical protein